MARFKICKALKALNGKLKSFIHSKHLTHAFRKHKAVLTPEEQETMRQKEINDCLEIHNRQRLAVPGLSRPPLKWSENLAADAQRYVNILAEEDGGLHHETQFFQGENLWMQKNTKNISRAPFSRAVDEWSGGQEHYKGESLYFGGLLKYSFFTQIVWPTTMQVGMATAFSKDGKKQYIVARYWPEGNWLGESAYYGWTAIRNKQLPQR